MTQVQRWTGVVSANENGGFVAYGDYLALQAKLDAMGKVEPIYQYQMGDGSWIDQTKHSYDYNRNHAPHAIVRIVYTAPKALAPLTDEQRLAIFEEVKWEGEDGWEYYYGDVINAVERAHGIGGTP